MRGIGTYLLAAAAVAGIASLAQAADLPVKAPPPSVVAPVSSWNGFYIGGSVGARWADTTWTTTCIGGLANCPLNGLNPARIATNNPADFDSVSFRGGVYAGFNWQVAQRWVVGIEGDWAWGDNRKTIRGIPGTLIPAAFAATSDRSEVKQSWDASVRGRAGILVHPNVLLFGTAGASWLHITANAVCVPGNGNNYCGTSGTLTKTRLGWTAGGGLEWMVAPNWLARGEYRYADYGTLTGTFFHAEPTNIITADIKTRIHTALFGLAYKFGPSAIVARY